MIASEYFDRAEEEARLPRDHSPRFIAMRAFMKLFSDYEEKKVNGTDLIAEGVGIFLAYMGGKVK